MISIVFPGQGSQKIGMGSDLYNEFDLVKKIFNQANDILGYKISDLIFDGSQDKLNQTIYTQPAIYLVGYSICELLKKKNFFHKKEINFLAGHSLGEYTALSYAGAISFEQGLLLLKSRGEAMQSAVPVGEGGMLAVLGSEANEIETLIKNNSENSECFLANDNSLGQVILSGKNNNLEISIYDSEDNDCLSVLGFVDECSQALPRRAL